LNIHYHIKFKDLAVGDNTAAPNSKICTVATLILWREEIKRNKTWWHNVHTKFHEKFIHWFKRFLGGTHKDKIPYASLYL
jgi:hypothetical protein